MSDDIISSQWHHAFIVRLSVVPVDLKVLLNATAWAIKKLMTKV
ncbi:MAG: hypothetical protein ACR2IB_01620 [Pyrinomonadaceae bacterium]